MPRRARCDPWGFEMRRCGLKVVALLSYMGGPMYVTNRIKTSRDDKFAFGVGFLPVAVMLFGVLTLAEDPDRPVACAKAVLWSGALAAAAGVVESAWATADVIRNGFEEGQYLLGCLASFAAVGGYAILLRREYFAIAVAGATPSFYSPMAS